MIGPKMENVAIWPLFSSPVSCYKISLSDSDRENILEFLENLDYVPYTDENGYTTQVESILDCPELSYLKKEINDRVQHFILETLAIQPNEGTEYYLYKSWVNLLKPGNFAYPHIHRNSMYSFVYYVNVPDDSGSIRFLREGGHSTHGFDSYQINYSGFNLLNSSEWKVTPTNGTLLVFPSNVKHEILPNLSPYNRYSIAGNYFVSGNIGPDYITRLNFS